MRFVLKYRFWMVMGMIIFIFFIGLKWYSQSKKQPNHTKPLLSVTVVQPQLKTVEAHLHVSGMTVAREENLVVSELSGLRIQDIFADVGQVVKKGQLLATLNRESLSNQVEQLSCEYACILDEYQRIEQLNKTGAISQQSIVQKKAASQSLKAKLEDAKLSLLRTNVVAPKDGMIFERKAVIGDTVSASQPLYRIAHGDIEFKAEIPEAKLSNIQSGQKVKLLFSGYQPMVEGVVRLIEPHINYATRTATVRITLKKQANNITFPIGLFGQAEIITNMVNGIDLPETALQQDSVGTYIWALDKQNKALRVPVFVRLRNDGRIMVEPFEGHTHIIAKAGAFVSKGEQLRVVKG